MNKTDFRVLGSAARGSIFHMAMGAAVIPKRVAAFNKLSSPRSPRKAGVWVLLYLPSSRPSRFPLQQHTNFMGPQLTFKTLDYRRCGCVTSRCFGGLFWLAATFWVAVPSAMPFPPLPAPVPASSRVGKSHSTARTALVFKPGCLVGKW
jgi:hypothetical protein